MLQKKQVNICVVVFFYIFLDIHNNHAVTSIFTTKSGNRFNMAYDAVGNMISQIDAEKGSSKSMEFDSDNRIKYVYDTDSGSLMGRYFYDDQGFRVRKVAQRTIKGEEKQIEVLYPSMYFGIEKQRTTDGSVIPNTTYAVNNIYLNGVADAFSHIRVRHRH